MKWGVRRFQNPDGTLTAAGKRRRGSSDKQVQKESRLRKAVKEYSSAYDRASSLEDRSDEEFAKAKEMYKNLGSNIFLRIREVQKGTAKAQEYLRQYDKAESLGNQAYDAWNEAMEKRKATGKTAITRLINNILYDPAITRSRDRIPKAAQPWSEKPSKKIPWDEKRSRPGSGGNI